MKTLADTLRKLAQEATRKDYENMVLNLPAELGKCAEGGDVTFALSAKYSRVAQAHYSAFCRWLEDRGLFWMCSTDEEGGSTAISWDPELAKAQAEAKAEEEASDEED